MTLDQMSQDKQIAGAVDQALLKDEQNADAAADQNE